MATESYAWKTGYKNSCRAMGCSSLNLSSKSSLSRSLATVICEEIFTMSDGVNFDNHSELYLNSVFSSSSILKICLL